LKESQAWNAAVDMASKKALTPSACQRKSFAKINIDQYRSISFSIFSINFNQS